MRGFELNPNMISAGANFVRDDRTAPCYRLWSIDDVHPAMIRTTDNTGTAVDLEIWDVPAAGLADILLQEPPGLTIGKVLLQDNTEVLGVVGEPFLVEGKREITEFGGWKAYAAA